MIERDYQELKQEIGLGHYEGRGWRGFHHHASLCVAAYGFLVAERCLFPPQARFTPVRVNVALVHKLADDRGAAAIAVCQAMRCDTGMPSRVIRLSTEQATRASVFWAGRVRARRPRPMMAL